MASSGSPSNVATLQSKGLTLASLHDYEMNQGLHEAPITSYGPARGVKGQGGSIPLAQDKTSPT